MPKVGTRKPERRSRLPGKENHGEPKTGTPMKCSEAFVPVAVWSYSSISSSFILMNQASSSRLQVVTLASSKTVDSPEMKRMFFAQPRMLRGAYSYSASDMSPVRGEILKRMDGPEKEAPWREMRALPTASTSSVSCV